MYLKKQFENIIGSQNIFDDQETLDKYSKDQSFVPYVKPDFVIFPKSTEEVQKIVKLANQTKTPITPSQQGWYHR